MSNKNRQKGFTILVAVITAGILLIIAMSIGGIALKEQLLSTANKDSQIAFYAADTGLECALYLDQNPRTGGVFGPDADGNTPATPPTGACGGSSIAFDTHTVSFTNHGGNQQAEYSYSFMVSGIPLGSVPTTVSTCAIVTITKDTNDTEKYGHTENATKTHTIVHSYGYNTCGPSLSRLERGITSEN